MKDISVLGENLDVKYAKELYTNIFDVVIERLENEDLDCLKTMVSEELDVLVISRTKSKEIVNKLDYDIFLHHQDTVLPRSWEGCAYYALETLCYRHFDIVKDVKDINDEKEETKAKLINEKLEANGFGERQANDSKLAIESVKEYFNFEFVDAWGDADYYVYNEQTADGYDLIVTTHDVNNINISEDVHYYDNDITDLVVNEITNSIYSEPETFKIHMCDMDFADCMSGIYEELFMDAAQRLTDEIIKKLKKEKLI